MGKKSEPLWNKVDISHIPPRPGVYFMKDKKEKILYIGKSKSLIHRVSSYFKKNTDLSFTKKDMVKKIFSVEIIETPSDLEALILETNLIKKHQPKYNILMKDDKNLSYIKITKDALPVISKTRKKISDSAFYYGPLSQYIHIDALIGTLRKVFCLGHHYVKDTTEIKKIWNFCMDFYIGNCPGHCSGEEKFIEIYKKNIQSCREFLSGKQKNFFQEIEEKMSEHAKKLEFEKAAILKKHKEQLLLFFEKQIMREAFSGDIDSCVYIDKYETIYIGVTQVRDGNIDDMKHISIKNPGKDSKEIIFEQALISLFLENDSRNISLLLDEGIVFSDTFYEFLRERNIKILSPKWEKNTELQSFTYQNIFTYAHGQEMKKLTQKTLSKKHQKNILQKLNYEVKNEKEILFECYDISHLHGNFTVGSRVVMVNGKMDSSKYKKYKIKTLAEGEINDFWSLEEVLFRRGKEMKKQNYFPDLIIIDGGKWQLSSAEKWLEKSLGKKHGVQICSIAKKQEEIFIPQEKKSILFEESSPELMIFQRARDESHRFAITFQRWSRKKILTKNILESLPGIGKKTRENFYKKHADISELEKLSLEELRKIFSLAQIETLKDHGYISME